MNWTLNVPQVCGITNSGAHVWLKYPCSLAASAVTSVMLSKVYVPVVFESWSVLHVIVPSLA